MVEGGNGIMSIATNDAIGIYCDIQAINGIKKDDLTSVEIQNILCKHECIEVEYGSSQKAVLRTACISSVIL